MSTTLQSDVVYKVRLNIRELAHEMVKLEGWVREAIARDNYALAGEFTLQREEVQAQRSGLMRELWMSRRQPLRHYK